jgi:hypothetical protein
MKHRSPSAHVSKLNPAWVKQVKREFLDFLRTTKFPEPVRNGTRGSRFAYPEWLIMLIAVLAVKAKVKSYLGIHRLAVTHWPEIRPDRQCAPISESQLRERLKKIRHTPRKPATFIFQVFPAQALG